jgi:hypothetical protein
MSDSTLGVLIERSAHRKREIVRHRPSPLLSHSRVRILIKSVVDFDKIENLRIRLKRRLDRNFEVSPPACPDKIISQYLLPLLPFSVGTAH